jgi:hypothetical protein
MKRGHKKKCKTKPEENISNMKILKSSLRRSDPTELRYSDSEIINLLDNMPRRTYYNYVKKLQEQDMQIVEQWMAENVEHVLEEMMINRETLCQKLREVQAA